MLRLCSRTLVKVGMVRPVPVSVVAVRQLTKQTGLPKMPVPPLQQTCEIYLRYLEPLLEEDELRKARELVEEFQRAGGVGERLQRGLERRAQHTENWITEDFVKTEFLNKRASLVSVSNTGGVLPRKDYGDKEGQIRYAAHYLTAFLEFKKMVDDDTLPVDKMKGRPLCMRQYEQLISSCRIPGSTSDSLEFYARSANPPKHFAVIHNGQFFMLDAYHSDGTVLSEDELCVQLQRICDASPQTSEEPVGILTSQHRETWSRTYNNLMKDDTNRASLLAIQSSITTVCLDGAMPPVTEETYRKAAIFQMLHGGGSQWSSGNRWFDKGMQIILADSGISGAGLTHAAVDGVMAMILAEHTLTNIKKPKVVRPQQPLPVPQKLHFNITPEIRKDIEEAKQHIDTLIQRMDIQYAIVHHIGKSFLMAHKMSPDAFVQVAIQLAYYRRYQRICATWEPATLRLFSQGRLGFIHSHSPAAAAFAKAIDDPQKQNSEKVVLLRNAIKAHVWNTNMAISGQDVNNHLQGLKAQAVKENIPLPDLFTDTSFTKAFDYKLATSQVWSSSGTLPCIGSEPGQHMVVYHILNDHIDVSVSTLEVSSTSKELDAGAMVRSLDDALLDMKNLVEQTARVEQ